ncbi:hypothetical protein WR25_06273 [Diploscapter pachys]|uniref:Cysteine dioxygenase n=1 Tax=Diploscapter pachys TaxID=2018661 RepID=A0A2A2LX67_9BILA|nr:hypothetical protein WR25_06273 [Diploscapter pachys]
MVTLNELIRQLLIIFAHDHVDKDEVRKTLESYKSNREDWEKYAIFDQHKYTRNLVDTGNGKYNLIVLCWGPSMGSSIHDHTNSHCFVKILDGQLRETKFNWPHSNEEPLEPIEQTTYGIDEVSYMSDELGLHRMENPSHSDGAVSLHLYIPPYDHCNAFCERTGHKTECQVTFHSKYGKIADDHGSREGRIVEQAPTPTEAAEEEEKQCC